MEGMTIREDRGKRKEEKKEFRLEDQLDLIQYGSFEALKAANDEAMRRAREERNRK